MSLENELFRQLTSWAPLVALVGTRISPMMAPQGTTHPYVVYTEIAEDPTYLHKREEKAIGETRVQFDCYADTAAQADQVKVALKAALDNWSSPVVNRAFIRTGFKIYEPEQRLFRAVVDADIWSMFVAP